MPGPGPHQPHPRPHPEPHHGEVPPEDPHAGEEPHEDPNHPVEPHGEAGEPHGGEVGGGGVIDPKAPDPGKITHNTGENQDFINKQLGKLDPKPEKPDVQKPEEPQHHAGDLMLDNSDIVVHHEPQGIDGFNRFVVLEKVGPQGDVMGIDSASLIRLVSDPVRSDYIIIDLRASTSSEDFKNDQDRKQIRGAKHLPIAETPVGLDMGYKGDLFIPDTKSTDPAVLEKSRLAQEKVQKNWDHLVANTALPLQEALQKKYVFFHCRQSTNRTPFVASGYSKYVARPGQHVIIIEGGFGKYLGTADALLEPYEGQKAIAQIGS